MTIAARVDGTCCENERTSLCQEGEKAGCPTHTGCMCWAGLKNSASCVLLQLLKPKPLPGVLMPFRTEPNPLTRGLLHDYSVHPRHIWAEYSLRYFASNRTLIPIAGETVKIKLITLIKLEWIWKYSILFSWTNFQPKCFSKTAWGGLSTFLFCLKSEEEGWNICVGTHAVGW